ncbi:MAG: hypothetical protein RI957_42 [Verrucomicrobiota bacterium]
MHDLENFGRRIVYFHSQNVTKSVTLARKKNLAIVPRQSARLWPVVGALGWRGLWTGLPFCSDTSIPRNIGRDHSVTVTISHIPYETIFFVRHYAESRWYGLAVVHFRPHMDQCGWG